MQKEYRYNVNAEIRATQDGFIEGYAAVFGALSHDLGGFREFIRPGAFKETLDTGDIVASFNHDMNYVLGRKRSGTLELEEDDTGLYFRAQPPATQWADDLRVSIGRGDIDQCSFGFNVVKDQWEKRDGEQIRELIQVNLFDVGPVTFPAYPQTKRPARSLAEQFISRVSATADPEVIIYLRHQLDQLDAASELNQVGNAEDEAVDRAQVRNAHRKRQLKLAKLK